MTKIELLDGKYTVIHDNGRGLRALRYGEEWRNLAGDNLVMAMAQEIEHMRELLNKAYQYGTSSDAYQKDEDIREIYEYLYGGDDE